MTHVEGNFAEALRWNGSSSCDGVPGLIPEIETGSSDARDSNVPMREGATVVVSSCRPWILVVNNVVTLTLEPV